MARFVSHQGRFINVTSRDVINFIKDNTSLLLTIPKLQIILNETTNSINDIEALLHNNNVRVREHLRLGTPSLTENPTIKNVLKRFENAVYVLCVLCDTVDGGGASEQEKVVITNGEQIIEDLLNTLFSTVTLSSSNTNSAATE